MAAGKVDAIRALVEASKGCLSDTKSMIKSSRAPDRDSPDSAFAVTTRHSEQLLKDIGQLVGNLQESLQQHGAIEQMQSLEQSAAAATEKMRDLITFFKEKRTEPRADALEEKVLGLAAAINSLATAADLAGRLLKAAPPPASPTGSSQGDQKLPAPEQASEGPADFQPRTPNMAGRPSSAPTSLELGGQRRGANFAVSVRGALSESQTASLSSSGSVVVIDDSVGSSTRDDNRGLRGSGAFEIASATTEASAAAEAPLFERLANKFRARPTDADAQAQAAADAAAATPPTAPSVDFQALSVTMKSCFDQLVAFSKSSDKPTVADLFLASQQIASDHLERMLSLLLDLDLTDEAARMQTLGMQLLEQIHLCFNSSQSYTAGRLEVLCERLDEAMWWLQVAYRHCRSRAALKAQIARSLNQNGRPSSNQSTRSVLDTQTLLVSLGLPMLDVVKTVAVSTETYVDQFVEQMFAKYYAKIAPQRKAADFSVKVPGTHLVLANGHELLSNVLADRVAAKSRVELILIEKEHENFTVPASVVNAEKKRATTIDDSSLTLYPGTASEQLKAFEASGQDILAALILKAGLKMADFKELFAYDTYAKRKDALPDLLKAKRADLLPVFESLNDVVAATFDQYEGLRQVADFRGLPEIGEGLVREGAAINNAFKKMLVSAEVSLLENALESNKGVPPSTEESFRTASKQLLVNFQALKVGILRRVGFVSSVQLNVNYSVARSFTAKVFATTFKHIAQIRKQFNQKFAEIGSLPTDVQNQIFAKFSGPLQLEMQIEKHFHAIEPWVEEWVAVQVPSIVQRELFAPNQQAVEEMLLENTGRALAGFQELLSSHIIDPLLCLDEILQKLSSEMEQTKEPAKKSHR